VQPAALIASDQSRLHGCPRIPILKRVLLRGEARSATAPEKASTAPVGSTTFTCPRAPCNGHCDARCSTRPGAVWSNSTRRFAVTVFIFPQPAPRQSELQIYAHAVLLLARHWPGNGERFVILVRHACGGCRFFTRPTTFSSTVAAGSPRPG
jgi:hypothetical protein